MQRHVRLITILFYCAALGACTGQSAGERQHASGAHTDAVESVPTFETAEAKGRAPDAQLQGSDPWRDVIEPLQASFFRSEILQEPFASPTNRARLLNHYNGAILELARRDPKDPRLPALLDNYAAVVTTGCHFPAFSFCTLVDLFKEAANSWDVWNLVLAMPGRELKQQSAFIRIGWALQNQRPDPSIAVRYLAIAPAIERDLRAEPNRDLAQEHYLFIERIISSSANLHQEPAYQSYLRESLRQPLPAIGAALQQRVRSLLLQQEVPRGLLREPWIEEAFRESFGNSARGFDAHLAYIQKNSRFVLDNFRLKPMERRDVIFYLIDNVFTGIWNPAHAHTYYQYSGVSPQVMLEALRVYSQTVVLSAIVESHQGMGELWRHPEQFRSNDLHRRALEKSRELHSRWISLYGQMARVRDLAKLIYGKDSPEFTGLKINQDDLNETVTYAVSYPFMMIMTYQMAVHRFVFRGWYRDIEHYQVIEAFFNSSIGESWFDYTQDREAGVRAFTPTDILYSFHYALKVEAFETFNVKPIHFVETISQALLRGSLETVRRSYKHFAGPLRAYSSDWEKVLRFCQEVRGASSQSNDGVAREKSVSAILEVPIERITSGVLSETQFGGGFIRESARIPNDHSTPLQAILKFWTNAHEEGLEGVRVGLSGRVAYIRDLIAVARLHLLSRNHSEAEIAQELAPAEASLKDAQHEYRRYLGLVFPLFRDSVIPCSLEMTRWEFELHNRLVALDLEYFKQVFRDYQHLKRRKAEVQTEDIYQSQDPRILEILGRYRVRGYGELYQGFDRFRFDIGGYETFGLDTAFRYARFLQEGLQTETFQQEALAPAFILRLPVRGLRDVDLFKLEERKGVMLNVEHSPNEEEFARAAVRAVHGSGNGLREGGLAFFHVNSAYVGSQLPYNLLSMAVSLFRFGEIEAYAPNQPHCFVDQVPNQDQCQLEKYKLQDSDVKKLMNGIWDILGGNATERATLDLIGRPFRGFRMAIPSENRTMSEASWGYRITYNALNMDALAFYDTFYVLSRLPRLGDTKRIPWEVPIGLPPPTDSDRGNLLPLRRAEQIFKAREQEKFFMYPVSQEIGEALVARMRPVVQAEFAAPARVAAIAADAELEDQQNQFTREYRIPLLRSAWTRGFYLNPIYTEEQKAAEMDFHRSTKHLYRP